MGPPVEFRLQRSREDPEHHRSRKGRALGRSVRQESPAGNSSTPRQGLRRPESRNDDVAFHHSRLRAPRLECAAQPLIESTVGQAAKAVRDEEMRAETEDFIEGFNQPTYRGMRVSGVRVATWSSQHGWSGDTRPDAEWLH
jgi:hypothetical protein